VFGTIFAAGHERISPPKYKQEGVVQFVIDAVYALAHAMHNMIQATCRGQTFCSEVNPPDGATLLSFIRNVSFRGRKERIKLLIKLLLPSFGIFPDSRS
jgi:hypothetical protein